MSAIWGVITQDRMINIEEKEEKLRSAYNHCVIDRVEFFSEEKIGIGCGIQYFTPEACEEQLPIIDMENGIYFTADVVLDNRETGAYIILGVPDVRKNAAAAHDQGQN